MKETSNQNACLLNSLNRHDAEYIVIGGVAVNYYCPKRPFRDLDLLIGQNPTNRDKVDVALVDLRRKGIVDELELRSFREVPKLKKQGYLTLGQYSRGGLHAEIHILPDSFDFGSQFRRSIQAIVDGNSVRIISCFDLISAKRLIIRCVSASLVRNSRDEHALERLEREKRDVRMLEERCGH